MTRHPFDSSELGRTDPELDRVADRLERYAADARGEPPMDLSARIRAAVEAQPHRRGTLASFLAAWSGPTRAFAAGGVVALVLVGALALGQLVERAREQVGATPSPSVFPTPTPAPTPSPMPSPTPTSTPSPTATPTSSPSPTDETETESPEPSQSDDSGGGSDNSGPGGGGSGSGSGNSGPGGGGD